MSFSKLLIGYFQLTPDLPPERVPARARFTDRLTNRIQFKDQTTTPTEPSSTPTHHEQKGKRTIEIDESNNTIHELNLRGELDS